MNLNSGVSETGTKQHNINHASTLLGPNDLPAFDVINENGSAPFLLVCDHARNRIPESLKQLGVADWVLDKHVASDMGARDLTLALSKRFDAPAVLSNFSRLVIDPNRPIDSRAAFVRVSDGIAIPGNIELTPEDRQRRIDELFHPYHAAIETKLASFEQIGKVPALISIHTCTPVFDRVVRRWHIGVMWDKDPRLAKRVLAALAPVPDICVGDNEPYSGAHPHDFTIDNHAENNGYPCIGIEVRQDLVESPEGVEKWGTLLGDALAEATNDPDLYTLLNN